MYSLHDLLDLENRVSFVLGNSGNVAAAAATTTTTTNTKYIYFFQARGKLTVSFTGSSRSFVPKDRFTWPARTRVILKTAPALFGFCPLGLC